MRQWLETELYQLGQLEYILLFGLISALCLYLLYRGYKYYQRFRYMDGIATSRIRSASQGYVELKGLGEWMPGDQIHSPFSGSRCLWYHCLIEEKQRSDKRTGWTNISNQLSETLFQLVDETGVCVIDPEDALVIPEIERKWYGSGLGAQNNPPKSSNRWMSISLSSGLGSYRFTEKLIRPASQVYALGNFKTLRSTPSNTYIEQQVKELLREWKLKPAKYLSGFDMDKNGKIEKQEWINIRGAARRAVLASLSKQNQPQNLMSKSTQDNQPFIISAIGEEDLLSKKKLMSVLSLLVAFALFIVLLICLSIRPMIS